MTAFRRRAPKVATVRACGFAILLAVLACANLVYAQESGDDDHKAVLEAGAVAEHGSEGGSGRFGGTLGVEVSPIDNWLELEFGVAALHSPGATEYSSDLVFKKPFRLSETSEFMLGLGPFVSRTVSGSQKDTSHGVEAVLDFMFWVQKDFGFYVEPGWSRTSGTGERSIGVTVGLLFGWR